MSANGKAPGDWELGQMASSQHFFEDEKRVMISCKGNHTIVCAGMLPLAELDGSFFTLAVHLEGSFRLTERTSGMLDAFRCSIQVMLSHQLSVMELMDRMPGREVEATCVCCRRLKSRGVNGWQHWDDYRFSTTGQATSHSICESCAIELYGEEVMKEIACIFPAKSGG